MTTGMPPVAIIMGSRSDWPTMKHAADALDRLGVSWSARVVSAHRTPRRLFDFATGIVLPIGISFYTFQGLSYVIDVWRGTLPKPERNPILFAAYLAFFPQLIAGPIVRFGDVVADFHAPKLSADMFAAGAARFLVGLAKKVLVADLVAPIADAAFDQSGDSLTFAGAWIGSLAYTIQIYFDFSGYSDMAIGMCLMFGIRIPENFAHPYASRTITEFWRRWHISLSTWFRDYLYIPLGGNRAGAGRTYLNLVIVFLATGLWHGAAWTFVLWGLYHGAFLAAERALLGHRARDIPLFWPRLAYSLPVIVVGWALFRSTDLPGFLQHFEAMVSPFAEMAWTPLSMGAPTLARSPIPEKRRRTRHWAATVTSGVPVRVAGCARLL